MDEILGDHYLADTGTTNYRVIFAPGQLSELSLNSIYADIASVASVKRGASAPRLFTGSFVKNRSLNCARAVTYRISEIPSKKHKFTGRPIL